MTLKVWYKDGTHKRFTDVLDISYNYNGVGDIQFSHGKYSTQYKIEYLFTKDIERFLVT